MGRTRLLIGAMMVLLLVGISVGSESTDKTAALQGQTPTITPTFPPHLPIITVRNAARLAELVDPPGLTYEITGIVFSPDSSLLAAIQNGGDIFLWNTKTWSIVATLSTDAQELTSSNIEFSPDGKLLATGKDIESNSVLLWDVQEALHSSNAQPAKFFRNPDVSFTRSIAFRPGGKILASLDDNGNIRLWDIATGKNIDWLQTGDGGPAQVLFSPDGKTLAYTTTKDVHLIDMQTKAQKSIPSTSAFALAFSPDSSKLAFERQYKVVLWDLKANKELFALDTSPTFGGVGAMAFSPDGTLLAAGAVYEGLLVWNTSTGNQLSSLGNGGIDAMSFSPNGAMLVVGHGGSGISTWADLWGVQ